ncbi:MAG: hypothetical protein WD535_01560 [Thermaerobacterales bacterium]
MDHAAEVVRFARRERRILTVCMNFPYPLTLPNAMVVDQSIHHFDLMPYVPGGEIAAVTARTWNPPRSRYEADSVVSTIFELDNSVHTTYLGSWIGGWKKQSVQWRTYCAQGIIIQRAIHDDHMRTLVPTFACIESHATGRQVVISELCRRYGL